MHPLSDGDSGPRLEPHGALRRDCGRREGREGHKQPRATNHRQGPSSTHTPPKQLPVDATSVRCVRHNKPQQTDTTNHNKPSREDWGTDGYRRPLAPSTFLPAAPIRRLPHVAGAVCTVCMLNSPASASRRLYFSTWPWSAPRSLDHPDPLTAPASSTHH